jgi:hypothetical protein
MTAAVALAAMLVSSAGQAAGRAPTPTLAVSLDVDDCALVGSDDVGRLTALELDVPVMTASAADQQVTRIKVVCVDARIQITVLDPLTGKQLTRMLALAPEERNVVTRLVAIAASELVITSWIELTLPGASVPSVNGAAPSPALRGAAQERAYRRLPPRGGLGYFMLLANAVGPFTGIGLSWGGGGRLGWTSGGARVQDGDHRLVWRLGTDLDLGIARAEVDTAPGTAHVSMWSAALRASLRLYRARAWLDAGAGGRLGLARIEGIPFDATTTRGGTVAGAWGGPVVYLGVGLGIRRLVLATGIEAGVVVRGVSGLADDGTPVSVSGRWLSGTVGIGWGG